MIYRLLAALTLSIATLSAAEPPTKAKTTKAKTSETAKTKAPMTPKQKDARRAALQSTIDASQRKMDAYDKQSSFKPGAKITAEQYERARANRDAAQAERDSLAN